MGPKPSLNIHSVRRTEFKLLLFSFWFIILGKFNRKIRATAHYQEWHELPMNYARIIELPAALCYLAPRKQDYILDVSSPKLLSLYLASKHYSEVTAADLENYFVEDFRVYQNEKNLRIKTNVFNAAENIPYSDAFFDKVFSISVLEHIPQNGDYLAVAEILRVLKPGGTLVITLPAFNHYVEEWLTKKQYWQSVQDEQGRTFFQRRYDEKALRALLDHANLSIEGITLVAEKPIRPPEIGPDGMMLHNSYLINQIPLSRLVLKVARKLRKIPFLHYVSERIASAKCHYLTTDWSDPNIRQVVVRATKRE